MTTFGTEPSGYAVNITQCWNHFWESAKKFQALATFRATSLPGNFRAAHFPKYFGGTKTVSIPHGCKKILLEKMLPLGPKTQQGK